ncbi:MAG: FGGY-family carbohydrate kinase [Pseudomonadota bacterium]
MSEIALGIDVGTSGIRVAALTPAGERIAHASAMMVEIGDDRRAPSVWEGALKGALVRLSKNIDVKTVGAVAVDGTSGTVLGIGADGTPVGQALLYNDTVDEPAIVSRIDEVAPLDTAARGASSALARAIALMKRPGVVKIVHQADWIASLLAGGPVPSDESNALKTGYDPIQRQWPQWIEDAGLPLNALPEVVPAGTVTSRTSGAFALREGALVVAGVSDGCASFLATGAAQPGEGVTALGTTLTIKLLSDRPVFAPQYGIYSHRIGDIWLAGGASNTGGGVLSTFFSDDQLTLLSAKIDTSVDCGLDYYPLAKPGERFPISDPAMAPRVSPRPSEDEQFLHGLLEGIARIEALGYRRLQELGAPSLKALYTVGGGAKNETWSRLRGRIVGAPGRPAKSVDACEGVAKLGLPHLVQ